MSAVGTDEGDKIIPSWNDADSGSDGRTIASLKANGRHKELLGIKEREIERFMKETESTEGRNRPLNLALIGPPGVGKSSTINTFIASFNNDKWREHAMTGSFGGGPGQITYLTSSFPSNKWYLGKKDSASKLPTFIDIAGFNDEDSEINEELIRIVFYGRLPEEDSLKNAQAYAKNHGLKGLIQKYSENKEELKVNRIIFVGSAREDVPKRLINCVVRAACPSGGPESRGKMTIPLFGVLTKTDSVDLKDPDMQEREREDMEEREREFIASLGLVGSEHRYTRLLNYCDNVDKNKMRMESVLPELDIPALKFLNQVCSDSYQVLAKDETYEDTIKETANRIEPRGVVAHPPRVNEPPQQEQADVPVNRRPPRRDDYVKQILTCSIKVLFVAILVYFIALTSSDVAENFDSLCAKFEAGQRCDGINDNIRLLCTRKKELIHKPIVLPMLALLVLIIVSDLFLPSWIQSIMERFNPDHANN